MQLNERLNGRLNKLNLLYEDENGPPLELSRYPAVKKHMLANYHPAIKIEEEIAALKDMAFQYPKGENPPNYEAAVKALRRSQAAFNRLLQRVQLNPMSGLRGGSEYARLSEYAARAAAKREKFRDRPNEYIVICADVDDMKYLNDKSGLGHSGVNSILQYIGELFTECFQIENTKLFHPHGDEFRVISHLGRNADPEEARMRFARLIQGCLEVSNRLASTGFHMEGWDPSDRVQPTISFGVSTSDTAADGILTYVKSGGSSGKEMKFAIVVDRDLRYDLGLTPEEMNKYINSIKSKATDAQVSLQSWQDPHKSGPAEVVSVDPPEVAVYESKLPMEQLRGKQGPAILECSWTENPMKEEIKRIRDGKREYLKRPGGALVLEDGTVIPLKEALQSSR